MTVMARLMAVIAKTRPRTLAAVFGAFHVVIFSLAWSTAKDLAGPWYNAEISRWTYFGYLVASAALLAGLGVAIVARTNVLDRLIAVLEARAAKAPSRVAAESPSEAAPEPPPPKDRVDRDIDDLLESLSEMEATTVAEAELEEAGVEAPPPPPEASADVTVERARLEGMRWAVRAYLVGPAAVATLFLGISGAMLPGTGGFLQSYHQLNTTLILGIGYGWVGLAAYTILAILRAVRPG